MPYPGTPKHGFPLIPDGDTAWGQGMRDFMTQNDGLVLGSRSDLVWTTASLAPGATENADLVFVKAARLYRLQTSQPARVRLYSTAAARLADASRPWSTYPAVGSGCLLQVTTDATHLDIRLEKATFENQDTPPVGTVYVAVTNLESTGPVTVHLTHLFSEV